MDHVRRIVAEIDPIEVSPHTVRATSKKFRLLYDCNGGVWSSLWKRLHSGSVQNLPWEEMRVRCNAWIRTRVIDSIAEGLPLPPDFARAYVKPEGHLHHECGALRWETGTLLNLQGGEFQRLPEGMLSCPCHWRALICPAPATGRHCPVLPLPLSVVAVMSLSSLHTVSTLRHASCIIGLTFRDVGRLRASSQPQGPRPAELQESQLPPRK